MNASFSPEVVGIICNKILATIEKVLLIKFPFIRDLGIGNNPFYNFFFFNFNYLLRENDPTNKGINCTVRNNTKKCIPPLLALEGRLFLCWNVFYIFIVRIDATYLFKNRIWSINDSLFTRFWGHNHYVGKMAKWLKA